MEILTPLPVPVQDGGEIRLHFRDAVTSEWLNQNVGFIVEESNEGGRHEGYRVAGFIPREHGIDFGWEPSEVYGYVEIDDSGHVVTIHFDTSDVYVTILKMFTLDDMPEVLTYPELPYIVAEGSKMAVVVKGEFEQQAFHDGALRMMYAVDGSEPERAKASYQNLFWDLETVQGRVEIDSDYWDYVPDNGLLPVTIFELSMGQNTNGVTITSFVRLPWISGVNEITEGVTYEDDTVNGFYRIGDDYKRFVLSKDGKNIITGQEVNSLGEAGCLEVSWNGELSPVTSLKTRPDDVGLETLPYRVVSKSPDGIQDVGLIVDYADNIENDFFAVLEDTPFGRNPCEMGDLAPAYIHEI